MLNSRSLLAVVLILIFSATSFTQTAPAVHDDLPDSLFRDMVIFNHFDLEEVRQRTIGVEVETAGLSAEDMIPVLIDHLGGYDGGMRLHGSENAHFIYGTRIGTVRLEPVNLTRILNRWNETHPDRKPNQVLAHFVAEFDKVFGRLEVVTEPLHYEQVKDFSKAVDAIGLAGAKGASNFGRFISTQPNIGIDHSNPDLIKNMLANYYRNKKAIHKDINPILLRQQFLHVITNKFMEKLDDESWNPTITELFDWYVQGSKEKLSRLQLYNALITNPENYARRRKTVVGKERPQRPVAEFREANSIMSTEKDPTRASRSIMREVDFALAMVEVSEKHGDINLDSEEDLFFRNVVTKKTTDVAPEEVPELRDFLAQKYFYAMKTKPADQADVVFANPALLAKWGITGSTKAVKAQVAARYGLDIDSTHVDPATNLPGVSGNPQDPIAMAHNDGAGGVGDGRAITVAQVNGIALSLKGPGVTPYHPQKYAMILGFHTGGVDGRMSYKEGIRVWIKGEILNTLNVLSERAAAIIDNHTVFTKQGKGAPSAELLREIPAGGIRNSHLNSWDPIQTRRGLEFLKAVASQEYGRKFTDSAYVVFDAVKTAELAAKMQDYYLIQGVLSKGNVLAYPGLVDISAISFLEVPDPEYTSFAYLSRFGNQANTLKRLLGDRVDAYAKTNGALKKIDVKQIFDQAYRRELSILAIMRLGLTRSASEQVFTSDSAAALEYGDLVWKSQFGHLNTDVDVIQMEIPAYFARVKSAQLSSFAVTAEILNAANNNPRKFLTSRRESLARYANKLHGRYSRLPEKDAREIVARGLDLYEKGKAIDGISDDLAMKRAQSRESLFDNIDTQVEALVQDANNAKIANQKLKPTIEKINEFLTEFQERVDASEKLNMKAAQCIDPMKKVSG